MFEVPLALDGGANVLIALDIDQTLQPIPLRESLCQAFAMLPCAFGEIAGDPDIERAVGPVCHDVNPSPVHGPRNWHGATPTATASWMAGSPPDLIRGGHDGEIWRYRRPLQRQALRSAPGRARTRSARASPPRAAPGRGPLHSADGCAFATSTLRPGSWQQFSP